MKAADVRNLSVDALQAKLNDTREELMKMRFQQATGELTDFTRLRSIRRDIARMMTIMHEIKQSEAGGEK
jgi:large subunit ribosomal protein L29